MEKLLKIIKEVYHDIEPDIKILIVMGVFGAFFFTAMYYRACHKYRPSFKDAKELREEDKLPEMFK